MAPDGDCGEFHQGVQDTPTAAGKAAEVSQEAVDELAAKIARACAEAQACGDLTIGQANTQVPM